jgi:hypothetical protein
VTQFLAFCNIMHIHTHAIVSELCTTSWKIQRHSSLHLWDLQQKKNVALNLSSGFELEVIFETALVYESDVFKQWYIVRSSLYYIIERFQNTFSPELWKWVAASVAEVTTVVRPVDCLRMELVRWTVVLASNVWRLLLEAEENWTCLGRSLKGLKIQHI